MKTITPAAIAFALGMTVASSDAVLQSKVPVRQIGTLERVSSDTSLASIASAIALSHGNVLINDRVGHRVLLLDSTLADLKVVADSTAATGAMYGPRAENLIRFRGDSALLIDQNTLSMFVLTPTGDVARTMAMPRAQYSQELIAGAAIDWRGRLVFFDVFNGAQGVLMLGIGDQVCKDTHPSPAGSGGVAHVWIEGACGNRFVDSMPLLRIDLITRALDTISYLAIPKLRRSFKLDSNGGLTAIETMYNPLPFVDAWTVRSDGTIAVLRARDYHVDRLDAAGTWTSTMKMPFDWQKVDDAHKTALIDSTAGRWQDQNQRIMNGGGRGATGLAPLIARRAELSEVADYMPPINDRAGALSPDAEGRVWIRTTTTLEGRPVYDVVDRQGDIVDRIQLPAFRTIAGFGPGVIYMVVQDARGKVHLERARIKS